MKRIYFILICFILTGFVNAQQTIDLKTGDLLNQTSLAIPIRNVENVADGIEITYTFDKILAQEDKLYLGSNHLYINGFGQNTNATEPDILVRWDSVTLPDGKNGIVYVVDSSFIDIPFALAPSYPLKRENDNSPFSKKNVPDILPYSGFFPENIISDMEMGIYRGEKILKIKIHPFKYDYLNKKIRVYTKIKYKVSYIESSNSPNFVKPVNKLLSRTTLNIAEEIIAPDVENNESIISDYLILTTSKYKNAAEYFARWKRTLGYNTHVIVEDYWTTNQVKDTVENIYNNCVSLDNLLIIGGHDDIPAKPMDTFYTDYFYGCLDGDDDIMPDINRGRLLVSSEENALTIINKIINYESNPTTDSTFYKTGLHCAYFQDVNTDGYEDARFSQTSEDVRNYVTQLGKTVKRIYYTNSYVNPTNWDSTYYSFGERIPQELQRPYFSWNGNNEDITDSISDGAFYVLYRGHGNHDKWHSLNYTVSDIDNLKNRNKYPVVFSITCSSGRMDSLNCFSQRMLTKDGGGCVAIISASDVSYSRTNDLLTFGLFDAMFPNPGINVTLPNSIAFLSNPSNTPIYKVGEIMDYGLTKMEETGIGLDLYSRMVYHCYGDPSMQIYTERPTAFDNVKILRSDKMISVTLNETANISFYNTKTNEVLLYSSKSALYSGKNDDVVVCISGHNKIPYIDDPTVIYIQDEIVDGYDYEADIIRIGSNVTSEINEGPVIFDGEKSTLKAKYISIQGETIINKGTAVDLIVK